MKTTPEQRADLEAKAKASQWRDASGVGSTVALEAYRGAANPTTVLALLSDLKEAEAELERMRDDAVKKQRAIDKLAEYADLYDQARGALDEARSERDKLKADNNKLREHARGEIRAWFDENKDVVVRDIGDENGKLEKENDKLKADCDHWRKKWEDLEVKRASCCSAMEDENKRLKADLAESIAARETAVRLAMRSDADLAKARAELAARKEAMDAREKIDTELRAEIGRLEEYNRTLTRDGCSGCKTLEAELATVREKAMLEVADMLDVSDPCCAGKECNALHLTRADIVARIQGITHAPSK